MQSIYKLKTVQAAICTPTIVPRIVHSVDVWELIGGIGKVTGDFILDDDVSAAIRELVMRHGTPETYRVLVWAALQSRECFENIINTPGLAEYYVDQASEEVSDESYYGIIPHE